MHLKSPTEADYLGIYSIMFWTLTLIGVVKYASIALNADDHGEGTLKLTFVSLSKNSWSLHLSTVFSLFMFVHL